MKHLEAGLVAGVVFLVTYTVFVACIAIGPLAWLGVAVFLGATIIAAIIDWKTEEKP